MVSSENQPGVLFELDIPFCRRDTSTGNGGEIVECWKRAAELADVFRRLHGTEIFDSARNRCRECRKADAEVGLPDDGGRKI